MSTATLGSHPTISPLSKDQAAPSVQPIFDKLTHVFGHMPSFFATMARSPQALEHFMPLYSAVIDKGTVDAKLKDLAYLKTALINGCEYCHRAHSASGRRTASPTSRSRIWHSSSAAKPSTPRKGCAALR